VSGAPATHARTRPFSRATPPAKNSLLLVFNAGTTSIKIALFHTNGTDPLVACAAGHVVGIGTQPRFTVIDAACRPLVDRALPAADVSLHAGDLALFRAWLHEHHQGATLRAIGHRVLHGGQHFFEPVRVDAKVLAELEALVPLAPLHQPHNLAVIRAVQEASPDLPQVACFDTAFHRTQPAIAQAFALPRRLADEGVRRYGFHGLSYEYIASTLPTLGPELAGGRVIVAHLGNGASLCALQGSRSVATTMSFTPLDGLIMGTRCGALDPGVLLYLLGRHALDAPALEQLLWHESGLLGVSGISNDVRTLLASDDPRAREALDLFVYRVGRELGSLAAALGGLEAVVFTAGIGEGSAVIRAQICRQAAWLGLELDAAANERHGPRLSRPGSRVSAWMVPTNENLIIARHTLERVAQPNSPDPKPVITQA
jgi:acetate kinase